MLHLALATFYFFMYRAFGFGDIFVLHVHSIWLRGHISSSCTEHLALTTYYFFVYRAFGFGDILLLRVPGVVNLCGKQRENAQGVWTDSGVCSFLRGYTR